MTDLLIWLSIGYLLIIVLTMFLRGSHGRIAQYLILYSLLAIAWQVLQYLAYKEILNVISDRILRWIPPLGVLVLSVLFLALTRLFFARRLRNSIWVSIGFLWIVVVIIVIAVLNPGAETLSDQGSWALTQWTLIFGLFVVGWLTMMGNAAWLTFNEYGATRQPLHRNRIVYWILALVLTVGGDILVFFHYSLEGNVVRMVGALVAAYALLIERQMDVLRAGLRTLVYLITALLQAVIYILGFSIVYSHLQSNPDQPPIGYAILLAVLLAMIVNPLIGVVHRGINRSALGAQDASSIVREYSLAISNIVNLDTLSKIMLDLLNKTFDTGQAHLFLVDEINEEGKVYFRLGDLEQPAGTEQNTPTSKTPQRRLREDSPITRYFRQTFQPLRQYDLDFLPAFQNTPREEREWLHSLEADVCIPIHDQNGWTGLLVLGPKKSELPYTKEEISLMTTLAEQTAVALANARHFSDLVKLNADLQRATTALEKANQQLREMDEQKSAFIGVITHEMRTPFANIAFNLQILDMYGKDQLLPEQKEQLDAISNGIKAARKMVDNLILLAGFLNRTVELSPATLDFKEILRMALIPLKTFADQKSVGFHVNIVGKLQPVVGDAKLLADAVTQLVHNAIKFNKEGGQATVNCWTTTEALFFDVKDTGTGIPADRLPELWSSFTQTADSLKRGLEGLGLGLALVKNIVAAHDGEVWAESEAGRGSVFGFKIPLAPKTPGGELILLSK